MITLFNTLTVDPVVISIIGFVYVLAFIAIYQMHNAKEGALFLASITASIFMIYLFIQFPLISAGLILLVIGNILYNNLRSHS